MKITKYPNDMDPYKIAEDLARKECKVCPCCGRRESVMERWCDNEKTVGIIHRKTINWLSFKCLSCGAQWDSEPFETGEKKADPFIWFFWTLIIYVITATVLCIIASNKVGGFVASLMIAPIEFAISVSIYAVRPDL